MSFIPTIIAIAVAVIISLGAFGLLNIFSFPLALTPDRELAGYKDRSAGETAPLVTAYSGDAVQGDYVTDKNGRALYTTTLKSCTGSCLQVWPPYLVEGEFKTKGKLGVMVREDIRQVQYTWEGKALYYYSGDVAPKKTAGHEVNGVWFLARP